VEIVDHHWVKEFPGSITVCDRDGIVLAMNDRSLQAYQADGGEKLIGTNMLDCHPEPARAKLQHLMDTQTANVYTIEKNGVKKLIYQTPWHQDGQYAGFVELALEIPAQMPHFIRGG
jgi:transcriptional regulator with PAS, ATPase and Fis domain